MSMTISQAQGLATWVTTRQAQLTAQLGTAPAGDLPRLRAELDSLRALPASAQAWLDSGPGEVQALRTYTSLPGVPAPPAEALEVFRELATVQASNAPSLFGAAPLNGNPTVPLDPARLVPVLQLDPPGRAGVPGYDGRNYCAPTALAVVLTYLGHPFAQGKSPAQLIRELATLLGTVPDPNDPAGGTAPTALPAVLQRLGGLGVDQLRLADHPLQARNFGRLNTAQRDAALEQALGAARYAALRPLVATSVNAAAVTNLASNPSLVDDVYRWAFSALAAAPASQRFIDAPPTTVADKLATLRGKGLIRSDLQNLGVRHAMEDFITSHLAQGSPVEVNVSYSALHNVRAGRGHYVLCDQVELDANGRPSRIHITDSFPPAGRPQQYWVTADRFWLAASANSNCTLTAIGRVDDGSGSTPGAGSGNGTPPAPGGTGGTNGSAGSSTTPPTNNTPPTTGTAPAGGDPAVLQLLGLGFGDRQTSPTDGRIQLLQDTLVRLGFLDPAITRNSAYGKRVGEVTIEGVRALQRAYGLWQTPARAGAAGKLDAATVAVLADPRFPVQGAGRSIAAAHPELGRPTTPLQQTAPGQQRQYFDRGYVQLENGLAQVFDSAGALVEERRLGVCRTVAEANKHFVNQEGNTDWYVSPDPRQRAPDGPNDCGPASVVMILSALGLWGRPSAQETHRALRQVRAEALGKTRGADVVTDRTALETKEIYPALRAHGVRVETLPVWERRPPNNSFGPVLTHLDEALARNHPVFLGGVPGYAWAKRLYDQVNGSDRGYLDYTKQGMIGHFVALLGKTDAGNYIIGDPLSRYGAIEVTPAELEDFFRSQDTAQLPRLAAEIIPN